MTIDEAVFGHMTMVFHELLMDICRSKIIMSSSALMPYIQSKLLAVIEEVPETDNFYLSLSKEVSV